MMAPAESAVGARAEEVVFRLLAQIIVILVVSRIVAALGRKALGQTDVAGEILAGLALGPSLLGAVAPEAMAALFHPSTSSIFVGLAQVGLVLLMFQIGLEFEIGEAVSSARRTIVAVSAGGILLPFTLGYVTAPFFWSRLAEPRPSELGFRLFFATAMSITAIPILGRIFMELGLSHTRTAALTIGAAAIDDIIGWLLLGIVSTIVTSRFAAGPFALRVLALGVYLAAVILLVRKPLQRAVAARMDKAGGLDSTAISIVLVALFVSALVTSKLGVFAIIGGFVIGVALHRDRRFVAEWRARVGLLVNAFFLPLFFAYTGLRTDVGTLGSAEARLECLFVCAIAFLGKFGGAYLSARLTGEDHRSASAIGVCMNTRALMELVALNVGYDLGVLPRRIFTMLVIMAIASTYMATPLIRLLMSRERREQPAPALD
ncbi:MAG: cation:proton antiporter [Minicystis sp.]